MMMMMMMMMMIMMLRGTPLIEVQIKDGVVKFFLAPFSVVLVVVSL
jgi:hypothetical protein